MEHIFICYSRRDQNSALNFKESLENAGKDVWIDLEDLPASSIWRSEIRNAITESVAFIYLVSHNSLSSEYCQKEFEFAKQAGKRIFPILLAGITENDIPENIASYQWLEWDGSKKGLNLGKLITDIETDYELIRLRNQISHAARLWIDNDRNSSYLWPEERLRIFRFKFRNAAPPLSETEQEFLRPEQNRIIEELSDDNISHQRRMAVGERLAVIGDTRPGVGLRPDGLPDIVWCSVPHGKVHIDKDLNTYEGIESDHSVNPFFIAKYPITYLQFQAFVDDPLGYNSSDWWKDLAEHPDSPKSQRSQFINNPRDNVSWHECVAFSRWLSFRLPKDALPKVDEEGFEIRLPTEWEWQHAASGGDPSNTYPWGKEFFNNRCNTWEAGLNRAIAVGMYPDGMAPCGALDMSGNIYEWCLNHFDSRTVNIKGSRLRTLRGGAFLHHSEYATTFARISERPEVAWDTKFGFRLAYSIRKNIE